MYTHVVYADVVKSVLMPSNVLDTGIQWHIQRMSTGQDLEIGQKLARGMIGMSEQKISKEYRFEASHYLPNHPGKCARLHGHSYRVVVQVEGEVEDSGLNHHQADRGMVMDYAELDAIVKPIIERMDHTHLYWDDKHDAVFTTLTVLDAPPFIDSFTYIGDRTTAENLANFIFVSVFTYDVCGRFPRLIWAQVTVHETAKTSASYEGPTTYDIEMSK